MIMREWLSERGLHPASFHRAMLQTGTRFEQATNVLKYPRYSRATGELVGYKVRSIETGEQWNAPGGIPHSEVYPLMWADAEQEQASELWITEGESDLLAVVCQQPLPRHFDLMAVPGANAFPAEWVELVEAYGRVIVFPDTDEPGREMVQRVCSLVPTARYAQLPSSVSDVTDFLRDVGTVEDMVQLAHAAVAVAVEKPLRRQGWRWTSKEASEFDDLLTAVIARDTKLKRKGRELVAKCPLPGHDDKTPSFHVNPERGVWRCHGCGKAGDVVSYVKLRHNLNYQKANQWLREFR